LVSGGDAQQDAGSTPAIVNGVVDALALLGITHVDMPTRPEKIWRLLNTRV
jgi:carbon-monoxide dehydrogenase large subunit